MAQHRYQRTVRGVFAVAVAAATIGMAPASAMATPLHQAPPPTNQSDALKQYKQLAQQADQLNEQLNNAKVDLQNKQQQLAKAKADYAKATKDERTAQQQEKAEQGNVDSLSTASFEGARFNQMSALLTGKSSQDFLDEASALHVLSKNNDDMLQQYQGNVDKASNAANTAKDAQQRQQDSTNAAAQLVTSIQQKQTALNEQITQVKSALDKLSAAQRTSLRGGGDPVPPTTTTSQPPPSQGNTGSGGGVSYGPSGAANTALQAALSRRGDPYVWGASGPSSFDCSGLTMWSYAQAGISLPHSSSAQSTMGTAVSRDQLQPGDLVFFGDPVHHVGMYVGNGEMVDAPNEGEDVRVEPLQSDYSGARRIAG